MEQITANKKGLISLDCGLPLSDIYTFVHDTSEPHCHHFDNQLPIHIEDRHEDWIVFTKKYTLGKISVTLQHQIQKTDLGFIWEISRSILTNELHQCRFGITLPLGAFSIEDKNGHISTPLINYQQQWRNKYVNQTNIDLPIIRIKKLEPLIICSPITDNIQFFKFIEHDSEYLKIATQSGSELKLTLYILPENKHDLKQIYCNVFPKSRDYVYQAELLKRKIHSKYGIRVLSHEIFHQKEHTIYPPTVEELESYMELLEENLGFYPIEVFNYIGLKTISIGGYLTNNLELIKGYSESGGILLNASEKLGYSLKCRAIHHEIFHRIERTVVQKTHKLKTLWEKLPSHDSFTEHFREIRAITYPNEYRCEMFATFVLDPRFIRYLAEKDKIVRHKLEIVQSIFGYLSIKCDQIIQNHNQNSENTLVHISEQKNVHKFKSVETTNRLLIGIKNSCLPQMLTVLKDIPNALMIDNASQIPKEIDVAYVTINPLDFCAIEYIEHQIPIEDSFHQWLSMHSALENCNSATRLKSEDVLRFNISLIRDFLAGVGASFEVNNLWDIAGEIRPYHLDSVPFLKKIWNSFRDIPIITRVGYSDISYEE